MNVMFVDFTNVEFTDTLARRSLNSLFAELRSGPRCHGLRWFTIALARSSNAVEVVLAALPPESRTSFPDCRVTFARSSATLARGDRAAAQVCSNYMEGLRTSEEIVLKRHDRRHFFGVGSTAAARSAR
jgi:hypothetical protein